MSLPSGWGNILFLFSWYSIHPYVNAGVCTFQNHVRFYNLKPFKAFLTLNINTKHHQMTCKSVTHISSLYIFGVTPFQRCEYHFLVTISCSLYNLKTLQDIFMKLSSNINHHHITYRAQHMSICFFMFCFVCFFLCMFVLFCCFFVVFS